jgi:hypothetical protein
LFQEQAPWRYYDEILNTKYRRNNIGFSGYWQSYRYFEAISSILRADLKPPSPKSPAALELLLKIHECSSCFVHWRSYKETESELPAVNMDYYLKAITLMRKHCADMHFFIFSDHLEGAKNLFRKIGNRQQFTFVDLPESKGNRGSLDDFALMYETDHAIIADSSFSWWAAWLKVPKINQCIVCPAGVSPWGEDWSPASWKKIQSK